MDAHRSTQSKACRARGSLSVCCPCLLAARAHVVTEQHSRDSLPAMHKTKGRATVDPMSRPPFPFVSPVRGVSFHQDVVCTVRPGDAVSVLAEPDNAYDKDACAVLAAGERVGYLPRELSVRLRESGAVAWSGEVCEVLKGSKATGLRVRVQEEVVSPLLASRGEPELVDAQVEAGDEVERRRVSARSGRLLGVLARHESGQVVVRTVDGREVSYPESLVVLTS